MRAPTIKLSPVARAAVAAEREACAKLLDDAAATADAMAQRAVPDSRAAQLLAEHAREARHFAALIRARGAL